MDGFDCAEAEVSLGELFGPGENRGVKLPSLCRSVPSSPCVYPITSSPSVAENRWLDIIPSDDSAVHRSSRRLGKTGSGSSQYGDEATSWSLYGRTESSTCLARDSLLDLAPSDDMTLSWSLSSGEREDDSSLWDSYLSDLKNMQLDHTDSLYRQISLSIDGEEDLGLTFRRESPDVRRDANIPEFPSIFLPPERSASFSVGMSPDESSPSVSSRFHHRLVAGYMTPQKLPSDPGHSCFLGSEIQRSVTPSARRPEQLASSASRSVQLASHPRQQNDDSFLYAHLLPPQMRPPQKLASDPRHDGTFLGATILLPQVRPLQRLASEPPQMKPPLKIDSDVVFLDSNLLPPQMRSIQKLASDPCPDDSFLGAYLDAHLPHPQTRSLQKLAPDPHDDGSFLDSNLLPPQMRSIQKLASDPCHDDGSFILPPQMRSIQKLASDPCHDVSFLDSNLLPPQMRSIQKLASHPRHDGTVLDSNLLPPQMRSPQKLASDPRHDAPYLLPPQVRPLASDPRHDVAFLGSNLLPPQMMAPQKLPSDPRHDATYLLLPQMRPPQKLASDPRHDVAFLGSNLLPPQMMAPQKLSSDPRHDGAFIGSNLLSPQMMAPQKTPSDPRHDGAFLGAHLLTPQMKSIPSDPRHGGGNAVLCPEILNLLTGPHKAVPSAVPQRLTASYPTHDYVHHRPLRAPPQKLPSDLGHETDTARSTPNFPQRVADFVTAHRIPSALSSSSSSFSTLPSSRPDVENLPLSALELPSATVASRRYTQGLNATSYGLMSPISTPKATTGVDPRDPPPVVFVRDSEFLPVMTLKDLLLSPSTRRAVVIPKPLAASSTTLMLPKSLDGCALLDPPTPELSRCVLELRSPKENEPVARFLKPLLPKLTDLRGGDDVAWEASPQCCTHAFETWSDLLCGGDYRGLICPIVMSDQASCRRLQCLITRLSSRTRSIADEIERSFIPLAIDPFGNYIVQRLMETSCPSVLERCSQLLSPVALEVSCNVHGTRVLQRLIDCLDVASTLSKFESVDPDYDLSSSSLGELVSDPKLRYSQVSRLELLELILRPLCGSVSLLSTDQNGTHVIQRCLLLRGVPPITAMFHGEIIESLVSICGHRQGCCVVQRCLQAADSDTRDKIISILSDVLPAMVQDQFGNYVLQYALCLPGVLHTQAGFRIVEFTCNNIRNLSLHKFSSNVVEKILAEKGPASRLVLRAIRALGPAFCLDLVKDSYGNYVLQRAVNVATGEDAVGLLDHIMTISKDIPKSNSTARRIVARLLKKHHALLPLSPYATPRPSSTSSRSPSATSATSSSKEQQNPPPKSPATVIRKVDSFALPPAVPGRRRQQGGSQSGSGRRRRKGSFTSGSSICRTESVPRQQG